MAGFIGFYDGFGFYNRDLPRENGGRKRASAAERNYRMIFEDAITGIYETTVEGRYVASQSADRGNVRLRVARRDNQGSGKSEPLDFTLNRNRSEIFVRISRRKRAASPVLNRKFTGATARKSGLAKTRVAVRDKQRKTHWFSRHDD